MSTQKRRRHRHRTHGTTGGCGQCLFCGEILDVSCLAAVHGALAEGYNVSDRTGSTAYIDMCGIPVPAIVVEPDSDVARAGFQVVFLLCSEECAKAVCLASMLDHILSGNEPPTVAANTVCGLRLTEPGSGIGPQFERAMELLLPMVAEIAPHALNRLTLALGRDLIDPPPRGTGCVPTRQELEWAQRVMGERCAWCLCIFTDDTPVTTLHVKLQGDDDPVRYNGGIVSIVMAGRPIPIHIPVLESPTSRVGDGVFMLCSDECASALAAAIDNERRLSTLH